MSELLADTVKGGPQGRRQPAASSLCMQRERGVELLTPSCYSFARLCMAAGRFLSRGGFASYSPVTFNLDIFLKKHVRISILIVVTSSLLCREPTPSNPGHATQSS